MQSFYLIPEVHYHKNVEYVVSEHEKFHCVLNNVAYAVLCELEILEIH